MKLFVEGGGDRDDLKTACRHAFTAFFTAAGVAAKPRLVACGGRRQALHRFNSAVQRGEESAVLIDSEGPVGNEAAKSFVERTEAWSFPAAVNVEHVHLMIQCMEAWFLADPDALERYFGKGFRRDRLLLAPLLEQVSKPQLFKSLADATRQAKKGTYDKGRHSFALLAVLDPARVSARSPAVGRLIAFLSAM